MDVDKVGAGQECAIAGGQVPAGEVGGVSGIGVVGHEQVAAG